MAWNTVLVFVQDRMLGESLSWLSVVVWREWFILT